MARDSSNLSLARSFLARGTSHLRLQVHTCQTTELDTRLKEKTMKKFFGSFASACILMASMSAFPQDSMSQDSSKQDTMRKDDSMRNHSMKKDDSRKKDDTMKNDQMKQN
jgi:pentapeptide MXKDX repeat protein